LTFEIPFRVVDFIYDEYVQCFNEVKDDEQWAREDVIRRKL
jgi:hypothetical protein